MMKPCGISRHLTLKLYITLLVMVATTLAQDNTFSITYSRYDFKSLINQVTATCMDERRLPIPDAEFFRNRMAFNGGVRDGEEGSVTFIATRVTEGNFSCGMTGDDGTVTMSSSVRILALPDGSIPFDAATSYSKVGSRARVNCSIAPSQLFLGQYGVRWFNSSNPFDVIYDLPPRSSGATRKSLRYNIDPNTYALLINNVQPLDGITSYTCLLSIIDIIFPSPRRYTFEETRLINLTLVVFVPPAFTLLPSPVTLAQRKEANATFQCEVRSSPEPSHITWFFNNGDLEVQIRESSHYHVENSTISEGGTKHTSGAVTVLNVDGFSSGEIRCEAQYVAFIANREVVLERLSATTALAVLSRPTDLEAIASEDGGFIFKLTLNDALPIPVAVQIRFQDLDSDHVTRSTQSDVFMNTRTLTIYRDIVPYHRFQIRVGVTHESVHSQLFGDGTVYERSNSDREALIYKTLCVCETCTIALLLVILLILVGTRALESCLNKDKGHKAAKMFTNVNRKRATNLMMAVLPLRRKPVRNDSHEEELVPQEGTSGIEGDGDGIVEPHMTASGITDRLAENYVDALKMAVKFGKDDQKIKRVLVQNMEALMVKSEE